MAAVSGLARGERILIERRPPERRWPPVVVGSVCCSTCCCCCCCAHTLGSVVGAAGASIAVSADGSGRVAAAVYWGLVFLLAVPSGALVMLSGELSVGVILFLIFFPALQLAASVLALPLIALVPVDDKRRAFGSLGVITAASFVGAIVIGMIGLVVGLLLVGVFS
jgi:hypothetical protein